VAVGVVEDVVDERVGIACVRRMRRLGHRATMRPGRSGR
jgi:hypothetical protein